MKRSKSLIQRIRRMRESPNMPLNNGDSNGVNTYESGGSGRPNHKSQNSFAGRLAGGAIREQLPSPQEEDTANSGEGYFQQQPDMLGRKLSLMQRVGDVVRGRK